MASASTSSADLLRRAKAGSAEALDELYQRSGARLHAYIRLRMGRDLRAKLESRDILQVTLLKSLEHLKELRGSETPSLMAWLAKIADHEIRDRADYHGRGRRDAAREVAVDSDAALPSPARSALTKAILDERAEQLERALESLAADHRDVIVLRKFEELPFAEIARRLGRSEDACRMLLARAMTVLTLALEKAAR